jgi:hypothetical protein
MWPICSLANGADFRAGPNLRPDQHIYRAANRVWRPPRPPQPPATVSKFTVRQHLHDDRGYWSPYDLLGLFLSFIGPAPERATKRNLYLPMTAVYGRWCRQIAGRDCGGVGDLPYMFQCTWRTGPPTWFCLGSTLAGYNWGSNSTGTWRTVLSRARFALVDPIPLLQLSYNFNNSPMIEEHGEDSTRFGNCAETYPFAELLVYALCFFLYRASYTVSTAN